MRYRRCGQRRRLSPIRIAAFSAGSNEREGGSIRSLIDEIRLGDEYADRVS